MPKSTRVPRTSAKTREESYLEIYGRPVTGSGKVKAPGKKIKDVILEAQRGRCLYCGELIGALVRRKSDVVQLRINWDHFIPYSYLYANPSNNWVLACHVCNGIKGPRMFDSVLDAQRFIMLGWARKGYAILPEELQELLRAVPQE